MCARYASSDKWAVTGEYVLIRRSTRASAVALSPESPKRSAPILALARRPPRPRRAATQPAALGWRMQQPGVVAHAIVGAGSGMAAVVSGWNVALFDNFQLEASK